MSGNRHPPLAPRDSATSARSEATCSHACVLARGRLRVSFAPPPWFPPVGRGARSRFQRHVQGVHRVAPGWGGDVAARGRRSRTLRRRRAARGRDVDSGGAEETASGEVSAASLVARRPVQPAETAELDADGRGWGCPGRDGCGIARGEEASMVEPTHVGRRVHAGERRRRSSTRR
uniref:Uncharacterized protein n=1 Tax=Oryza glumipatula TaxID=40148 RepID=A0A0D9YS66_9ORYZ